MAAKAWEARMSRSWLPFVAAAVLFVTPLPAQQNLPASTQKRLATFARIEALTPGDFIGQRTGMSVEPSVLSGQQRAQRDLHTRFGSRSGRAHG